MQAARELLHSRVQWLLLIVEAIGVVIVGIGVSIASARFILGAAKGFDVDFDRIRLSSARFLVLGLGFQLAVDVQGYVF